MLTFRERTARHAASIFLAFAILVVGGCGGNNSAVTAPATTAPGTVTTTSVPVTTTAVPNAAASGPLLDHHWSWTETTPDGYRFRGFLATGTPDKAAGATILPGFSDGTSIAASCSAPLETTALIPAYVWMKNATVSFSADLDVRFNLPYSQGLNVAYQSSNGITCGVINNAQEYNVNWQGIAAGASTARNYFYIVVPNFYTPNTPRGAFGNLDGQRLVLASSTLTHKVLTYVSLAGPGVCGYSSTGGVKQPFVPITSVPIDGYTTCPSATDPGPQTAALR
jgi:hypothetical protein